MYIKCACLLCFSGKNKEKLQVDATATQTDGQSSSAADTTPPQAESQSSSAADTTPPQAESQSSSAAYTTPPPAGGQSSSTAETAPPIHVYPEPSQMTAGPGSVGKVLFWSLLLVV